MVIRSITRLAFTIVQASVRRDVTFSAARHTWLVIVNLQSILARWKARSVHQMPAFFTMFMILLGGHKKTLIGNYSNLVFVLVMKL